MIIKDVSRDDDEVDTKLRRGLSELLERREAGLANPMTGIFVEPRDSQAQVQIRSMEEANHEATFPNQASYRRLMAPCNESKA